jgi:hypothetical protein
MATTSSSATRITEAAKPALRMQIVGKPDEAPAVRIEVHRLMIIEAFPNAYLRAPSLQRADKAMLAEPTAEGRKTSP